MHTQAKFVDPITPHIPLRLKPDLAPEKHQTMRKTHAKGWPRVRAFVEFSDLGTLTTFAVKIYIAHFAVPMPSPSVVRARGALASFALHGGVGGWVFIVRARGLSSHCRGCGGFVGVLPLLRFCHIWCLVAHSKVEIGRFGQVRVEYFGRE